MKAHKPTPQTPTTDQQTILLSKKGMKELNHTIAQLERERQTVLTTLRELGKGIDYDHRFERNERLLRLESIESELAEKHQTLNNAKLLPTRRARMRVAIGSVVDLIDQQGRVFRYTLVDSLEANPSDGRISTVSPLGQTLVGKSLHDVVELEQGKVPKTLRLIRVT